MQYGAWKSSSVLAGVSQRLMLVQCNYWFHATTGSMQILVQELLVTWFQHECRIKWQSGLRGQDWSLQFLLLLSGTEVGYG